MGFLNRIYQDSTLHTQQLAPVSIRATMLGYIAVVLIAALPLFAHLEEVPIQLFDEQRLATNAMEMNRSGNLIVTTYLGEPDYSNTKPPLMIWLQALSMRAFGNNELAVRLPSVLAALATCLLLYGFFAHRLRMPLTGVMAVAILCTSAGYISLHGTRTGDYDSLLTLFTMAYCAAWFSFCEDGKPRRLYLFFILAMLAVMTKCTQACIMLPALAMYALWRKKVKAVLADKHFYLGMLVLIVPVLSYYLYRQSLDPGYWNAVQQMDLGGRYLGLLSYPAGPDYYINALIGGSFSPWWILVVPGCIAACYSGNSALRRLGIFLAMTIAVYLGVLSGSVTKFGWYLLPAYPLLAGLSAIGIAALLGFVKEQRLVKRTIIIALALILIFILPYRDALDHSINPQLPPSMAENHSMGVFMQEALHGKRLLGDARIAIRGYESNIRWYIRALAGSGKPVATVGDQKFFPGQKVIAFQEEEKAAIEADYETELLEDFRGVHTYLILRKR